MTPRARARPTLRLVSRARPRATGLREIPKSDFVLGGVLAVFAELDVLLSPDWSGPLAVNAVLAPAMALGLVWRRTHPLVALSGVVGVLVFLSLAFGSS